MKDVNRSIYYLNNFTMLIILQSIASYLRDRAALSGSHFNIDNYTVEKYRVLLNTGKMSSYNLYSDLLNNTEKLPYSYEHRKMAARFILNYVMEDSDAEVKLRNWLEDN